MYLTLFHNLYQLKVVFGVLLRKQVSIETEFYARQYTLHAKKMC